MCLEDRPISEPSAAGIDVGAREMFVAVPPGRDENPVRVFATFTEDLEQLTDWLEHCHNDGGAVSHWGVLDSPLRDSRTTGHPSLFSECPPHEERTRTAHRLARVSMVTVSALGGIIAGGISAWTRHLRHTDLAASPERIGFGGQSTRAAHAQSTDANEHTNPSRHQ